jgi:UDP-3-O-[3-hydroxymyristoyl] N-acetylglucosamine deacetylase
MFDNGLSEPLLFTPTPSSILTAGTATVGHWQQTIAKVVGCTGVGLHSGQHVRLTLRPAAADTGIVFRRTDLSGELIAAHWSRVTDTRLNTSIGNESGAVVRTIEHLMAAFAGMAIDNVIVDLDGAEVPVMDGSSAPFVALVEAAGVHELAAPRRAIKILKPVIVRDGDKCAMLAPADDFVVSIEIDFPVEAIGQQKFVQSVSGDGFKDEISRARTFGFEHEVAAMRAAGLGLGGSLDNAVVVASDGAQILNREGLRFKDEFVRHKVLDAIGDLALAGAPILGRFHGVRTGHALNNRLLRALFADASAARPVTMAGPKHFAAA